VGEEGTACKMAIANCKLRIGSVVAGLLATLLFFATGTRPAQAEPTLEQKQVDQAIVKALDFLARQQQPSGAWKADNYGEMTSITSLSIMAYLAAGHVPGEGPYSDSMQRGLRWVLSHQQRNGLIVHQSSHGPMYCHGISTLMLAEVIGMVPKEEAKPLREALERAVKLILDSQNLQKPRDQAGGWRYQPSSRDSDLSVTGWQLLALRAAKNVGCDVPAENIDRAVEYVRNCSSRGNRGFCYQPGGGPSPVMTGTGILALEICGQHHAPESLGGADFLLASPVRYQQPHFFYGAYYCGVGMFQIGGRHWEQSRDNLRKVLLPKQANDGSWVAEDEERGVGRPYATSMAVLSLAVEYQFLPIYQR
jgi:hypothetical protein